MVMFEDDEFNSGGIHSARESWAGLFIPGIHVSNTPGGRAGRTNPVLDTGTVESTSHSFSSEDTLLDISAMPNFSNTTDKDSDFPRSVPSTDSSYFSMPSTPWNICSPSDDAGAAICELSGYGFKGKPPNHIAYHAEHMILHNSSLATCSKKDHEKMSTREENIEKLINQFHQDCEELNHQPNKDKCRSRSHILGDPDNVAVLPSNRSASTSEPLNDSVEFTADGGIRTDTDLQTPIHDNTKEGKSVNSEDQSQSNGLFCSNNVLDDHPANLNQSSRNASADELFSNSATLYDRSQMPTPSTDSLDSFSSEESNFCIYEDDIPTISNKSLAIIVPVVAARFLESYRNVVGSIQNNTGGPRDQEDQGQCQGSKQQPQGVPSATKHSDKDEHRKRSEMRTPDDNDDDNGNKRKSKKHKSCPHEDETILWACPYMKRSPKEYRSCHKYIMKDISRVKQHLRRTHKIPLYCPRCNAEFDSEKERDAHNRIATCPVREAKTWEGVTAEQALQLERRVDRRLPKRDQWYSIYRILFPDGYPPCSPYIDYTLSAELQLFRDHVENGGQAILAQTIRETIPQSVVVHTDDNMALLQSSFQEAVHRILHSYQSMDAPAQPHQADDTEFGQCNLLESREEPTVESQGETIASPDLDSIIETPAIDDVLYQMRLPSDTSSLEDVAPLTSSIIPSHEMTHIPDNLLEGFIEGGPWNFAPWSTNSWSESMTVMDPELSGAECDPTAGTQVNQSRMMSSMVRGAGGNNLE